LKLQRRISKYRRVSFLISAIEKGTIFSHQKYSLRFIRNSDVALMQGSLKQAKKTCIEKIGKKSRGRLV